MLGYHNTGTSLVTKLLLLMGAYGGTLGSLFISEVNKLKFYERIDVISTNRQVCWGHLGSEGSSGGQSNMR